MNFNIYKNCLSLVLLIMCGTSPLSGILNFSSRESRFTLQPGAFINLGSSPLGLSSNSFSRAELITTTSGFISYGLGPNHTFASAAVVSLNGDKSFCANIGGLPLNLSATGTGNLLEGFPVLSTALTLVSSGIPFTDYDHLVTLSLGIHTYLNKDITLNDGVIYLLNDLKLGRDVFFQGKGLVVPNGYHIDFGSVDSHWTSTVKFQGNSDLYLNARIDLSGKWTFSGYCNLHGAGKVLDLSKGGVLEISGNSTLNISDIGIEGLGSGEIIFDGDGQLNIQNTTITLNSDYTFEEASIYVDGSALVVTSSHILTVDEDSAIVIDGGTLWYDTLRFPDVINIQISADAALTFSRGGIIRHAQSGASPEQFSPSTNTTIFTGIVLDASRKLDFQKTATAGAGVQQFTYNASYHDVLFSRINTPMLIAGPDTAVLFNNVVLKKFSPDYIELQSDFGAEDGSIIYGDGTTIELAFASDLATTLTFQGTTVLDGHDQILTLVDGGGIVVSQDSTLTLRNLVLRGLTGNNVRCIGDTAQLIFENVTLVHDANYSFTAGSFKVNGVLALEGSSTFGYETGITSTILNNSSLVVGRGMTFNYAPSIADRRLIVFEDSTATLLLNGATLASTSTGINLVGGILKLKNENKFESSATTIAEAIKLGNGLSDANDLIIKLLPGASVDIVSGYVDW